MKRIAYLLAAMATIGGIVGYFSFRGGKASYAVPHDVCDVPVSAQHVEPLLPEGDDLRQRQPDVDTPVPLVFVCRVEVDGEETLAVDVTASSVTTDIVASSQLGPGAYGLSSPIETTIDGYTAVLGPRAALVLMPCPAQGEGGALTVNVQSFAEPDGTSEEKRGLIEDFTADFLGGLKRSQGC
ncbi:hypothetical protein [Streptomyces hoynatensis]|uniref:Uncharacterized protein n=1 Tax=Streptomyces hoynatensis TaxID=1141874 RepID=A0A3A9YVC7_9ACTN|nr:hypothetical protein [Streptomyces hoynatensis]RKN40061.1 hypothetical protein D7294_19275 [Streptomyces hoynatensis]